MRFLLDTQIVIWAMVGSSRLSARAREILENSDNEFCVSAVSVWETAIKHSIKPEAIPVTAEQIVRFCNESGIEELRIGFEHSQCADSLPRHHNDPFDRIWSHKRKWKAFICFHMMAGCRPMAILSSMCD